MPPLDVTLAGLSLAAWLYLVFANGRFWLCDQRLDGRHAAPERWPSVVAVVPARNEADVIARSVRSLFDQDYPGPFRIVLVDDESEDGTAAEAERVAKGHERGHRLVVERTGERPEGWVGKMWAVHNGVQRAEIEAPHAEYWLLTDADVAHSSGNLRRLVAKAEGERLDLASLMVRLHADCAALARAGGIESLRGEIIDDCALGAAVKREGRIWLGLAETERSIRAYGGAGGVWNMVARSAFTQLRHSWVLLAGTLLGLALLYVVPPVLVAAAPLGVAPLAVGTGAAAWALMAASFTPTLALYGRSAWWGFALPLAGLLYAGMTLDSARRHVRSQGAEWKGRPGAGSVRAAGSRS
jgi:hypothetical protein